MWLCQHPHGWPLCCRWDCRPFETSHPGDVQCQSKACSPVRTHDFPRCSPGCRKSVHLQNGHALLNSMFLIFRIKWKNWRKVLGGISSLVPGQQLYLGCFLSGCRVQSQDVVSWGSGFGMFLINSGHLLWTDTMHTILYLKGPRKSWLFLCHQTYLGMKGSKFNPPPTEPVVLWEAGPGAQTTDIVISQNSLV